MPIDAKIQNLTKSLLKTALTQGMNISMFKTHILSGRKPTEEFENWFVERIELNRLFDEYKKNPTNERKQSLYQQVAVCDYPNVWIDSILENLKIVSKEDDVSAERAESNRRSQAQAAEARQKEEVERKRKEEETERKRLEEQLAKEKAERDRKAQAQVEAEAKRKEAEAKQKEAEEIAKTFMFCRMCRARISKNMIDCPVCGTRQTTKKCRKCKKVISEKANFCPLCGTLN